MTSRSRQQEDVVVLIGVAGSTSSGKTTLSRAILSLLPASVSHVATTPINLDWFMDPSRMPLYPAAEEQAPQDGLKARNWETPMGVRYDLLQRELGRLHDFVAQQQAKPRPERTRTFTLHGLNQPTVNLDICWSSDDNQDGPVVVVVEGFLLYFYPAVANLFSRRIWVETPLSVALQRRLNRDMPTRLHRVDECAAFEAWFERAIWKYYLTYKPVQIQHGDPYCTIHADWTAERQLEVVQDFLAPCCLYDTCDSERRSRLEHACAELEAEIEKDKVPILDRPEDFQAMDWAHEAEEAEKRGELNQACRLYRKIIKQSPAVAEFLGL